MRCCYAELANKSSKIFKVDNLERVWALPDSIARMPMPKSSNIIECRTMANCWTCGLVNVW